MQEYLCRLRSDPGEIDRLVEALVVPVTEFFRDAWVFAELSNRVVPWLVMHNDIIRAWVVGTATGEEAYSVAMVLAQGAAQHSGIGFEVIASDIDRRSVEFARAGVYPPDAVATIPAELRQRYVRLETDGARIAEGIRQRIRFAEHDLVGTQLAPRESIVAAFDLVLCRNVLLYFDDSLRTIAAERLAAVTEPDGVLVLGTSESLPPRIAADFEPFPDVVAGACIYRRRGR